MIAFLCSCASYYVSVGINGYNNDDDGNDGGVRHDRATEDDDNDDEIAAGNGNERVT